jgi:hypothetical protein
MAFSQKTDKSENFKTEEVHKKDGNLRVYQVVGARVLSP